MNLECGGWPQTTEHGIVRRMLVVVIARVPAALAERRRAFFSSRMCFRRRVVFLLLAGISFSAVALVALAFDAVHREVTCHLLEAQHAQCFSHIIRRNGLAVDVSAGKHSA